MTKKNSKIVSSTDSETDDKLTNNMLKKKMTMIHAFQSLGDLLYFPIGREDKALFQLITESIGKIETLTLMCKRQSAITRVIFKVTVIY